MSKMNQYFFIIIKWLSRMLNFDWSVAPPELWDILMFRITHCNAVYKLLIQVTDTGDVYIKQRCNWFISEVGCQSC